VSFSLQTIDQVPGARTVEGPRLSFRVGQVTAREIVSARVRAEIDGHNGRLQPRSYACSEPHGPEEQALNPARNTHPRPLDADAQIELALGEIRRGRVIILFNGEQVSDLDAPLLVTPVSEARFIRLVPLVGG